MGGGALLSIPTQPGRETIPVRGILKRQPRQIAFYAGSF
jgi:hypothetical protein